MRKLFILFGFLLVLTTSANSADTGLSTDLMQSIDDTNKSLSSNVATKDAKGSTSDAKDLTEMFAQVETFFEQKGDAPDAVDLAKKSKALTLEIVNSVAKNDFDTASNSATTLARTCRACHTFYKKE